MGGWCTYAVGTAIRPMFGSTLALCLRRGVSSQHARAQHFLKPPHIFKCTCFQCDATFRRTLPTPNKQHLQGVNSQHATLATACVGCETPEPFNFLHPALHVTGCRCCLQMIFNPNVRFNLLMVKNNMKVACQACVPHVGLAVVEPTPCE